MKKVEQPSPISTRAAMRMEAEDASANRIVPRTVSTAVPSIVRLGP